MARVPVPDHSSSQLLVEVKAAGLNPSNYKLSLARVPFVRHLNGGMHVVGYDVAGVALSVGSDSSCDGLRVNDAIYGFAAGAFAEYAVLSCSRAARSPKSISASAAAGLPVAALTSLAAWELAGIKKGTDVLVLGASGGCGIFGVSIANVLGARVTGLCSSKNVDFVRSLGASAVVDYKDPAALQALISSPPRFDIIYDTVSSFDPVDPDYEPTMRPLLKPNGRYRADCPPAARTVNRPLAP
jgi:NADPH:quinone reductase-like Zn-dependent oxidoreductase